VRPPEPAELDRAKNSLTRGYVRQFETSHQLARGLVMLAAGQLDEGAFDRFVPEVERVTRDDLERAALAHLHPSASAIVVVGDLEREGKSLESLGRPVTIVTPEF
jgi:predicted Zn-dependent peptidase